MTTTKHIRVLCVDDNAMVTDGLCVQFKNVPDIEVVGSAKNADDMLRKLEAEGCPDVILLDYDMPGTPPLESIEKVNERCGVARVVIFSGHVHRELVDRALDAGAWGYVAKFDSEDDLLDAIRSVAGGSFGFSRSARAAAQ